MQDILTYILPLITTAIGWFVSRFVERRKRNNDFISELQKSIDTLVEKYTTTLNELIEVKGQNADLILGQKKLESELHQLKAENTKLREQITQLNTMLENIKSIRTK
jgi:cell division protein FtsB